MKVIKKRYIGLDVFRAICVLTICAFHTIGNLGCDYGIFQIVLEKGAMFMTAFFMLSGFTLFINYANEDLRDIKTIKRYLINRTVGILPMYLLIGIIYEIIYIIFGKVRLLDAITLAPIEVLGLQSTFESLFWFSHNNGTWFISCILICYIVYPYLQEIIKQVSHREKVVLTVIGVMILLYAPIVARIFNTAWLYTNPFYRTLEFFIGILLASLRFDCEEDNIIKKYLFNWWSIGVEILVLIIGVSIFAKWGG